MISNYNIKIGLLKIYNNTDIYFIKNNNIRILHLCYDIDIETMKILSNLIQNNKTLTSLYLNNNINAEYISKSIEHNKSIVHMLLENNSITDIGALKLINAVMNNKKILVLGIWSDKMSDRIEDEYDKMEYELFNRDY